MATYRWTGASAAYSNVTSWLPTGLPASDDIATIDVFGIIATVSNVPSFVVGNTGSGALLVANTAELFLEPGIQIVVGNESGSHGTLALTSGATLVDQAGSNGDIIGFTLGATGTVSVDGAGTTWSTNGRIFVGLDGSGDLLISNGGSVSATGLGSPSDLAIYAGAAAGSTGSIEVTGSGSFMSATGRIGIGAPGDGELDISDGATVMTTATPTEGYSTVFAGGSPGSNGKIVVDGVGSRLDAGGGEIGVAVPISNGPLATGTLVVSGGATITAGSNLPTGQAGFLVGDSGDASSVSSIVAAGFVTIDGSGSLVSAQGNATFGRAGSAVLVMSNHGSASLGLIPGTIDQGVTFATSFGSTAQATIQSASSLSSFGRIFVGQNGNADVTIESGGHMSSTLNTADVSAGQGGVVVANSSGTSTLTVTGAGSSIGSNGNFSVGRGGEGLLAVENGASAITSAQLRLGGSPTFAVGIGTVTVDGVGSMLSAGSFADGVDASGTLGIGTGSLSVANGGHLIISGAAALAGSSSLSVDGLSEIEIGGTGDAMVGSLNIDAAGQLSGHGSITGTVSDAGTIDAVGGLLSFANTVAGTGLATVEAGATLELAAMKGNAVAVTFNGAGILKLDTPASFTGTLQALPIGGTIDLVGDAEATASLSSTTLQIRGLGGSYDYALLSSDTGLTVTTTADGTTGPLAGTDVVISCFVKGTHIATSKGDMRVEDLHEGDDVILARGGTAAIVWLGHRRVIARHHPRAGDVAPVRIKAGAFGPSRPTHDLRLSPDHAVFLEGVLIPVRNLVNGDAIVSESFEAVTYWHVELAAHDVLLAEGLPCESYLDTGNRSSFANANPTQIHPSFDRDVLAHSEGLNLVTSGLIVDQIKASLSTEWPKSVKRVS